MCGKAFAWWSLIRELVAVELTYSKSRCVADCSHHKAPSHQNIFYMSTFWLILDKNDNNYNYHTRSVWRRWMVHLMYQLWCSPHDQTHRNWMPYFWIGVKRCWIIQLCVRNSLVDSKCMITFIIKSDLIRMFIINCIFCSRCNQRKVINTCYFNSENGHSPRGHLFNNKKKYINT